MSDDNANPSPGAPEDAANSSEARSAKPLIIQMPVDIRNAMLTVIAVVLALGTLWFAKGLIIALVLAILGAYTLDPLVRAFERIGLPRVAAAAVVMITLASVGTGGAYALADEFTEAVASFPEATEKLRRELQSWKRSAGDSPVEKLSEAAEDLEDAAEEIAGEKPRATPGITRVEVVESPLQLRQLVLGGGLNLFAFSGQFLTLVFLTFFLLASGDLFKRKLVRLAGPTLTKRRITVEIIDDINRNIEDFLLVMAVTNAVVGICTWLVFRWLGMANAELWAIAAAVMNTIPYVGSFLVLVAATAIALIQFDSITTALAVGGAFLAITGLEGMLLKPWLMSRRAKLNTPAVFVSLLFWGWLWGMWGLLLAFPILMVLKTVADHIEGLRAVGELIGE